MRHVHTSSSHHLEQVARSLLENGADKDKIAADGQTALLMASIGGHAECGRILLEAGADHTPTFKGFTAQAFADALGHSSVSALFVSAP